MSWRADGIDWFASAVKPRELIKDGVAGYINQHPILGYGKVPRPQMFHDGKGFSGGLQLVSIESLRHQRSLPCEEKVAGRSLCKKRIGGANPRYLFGIQRADVDRIIFLLPTAGQVEEVAAIG